MACGVRAMKDSALGGDLPEQGDGQPAVGAIVAQRLGRELDQVFGITASVGQLYQAAGHWRPAQRLGHLGGTPLHAQIRQGFGDVVQQRGEEHDIGPDVALLVDLLDGGPGRQQMAIAPGHGRQGHLQRMRQQPADVRMVVRFGRRHQLHELGVPVDGRQQIALPDGLRQVRLAPQGFQGIGGTQAGQQLLAAQHPQPAALGALQR